MPQPKRRTSEAEIERKAQGDSDRINQFQQKKLAEQLTIGMAVRNATLEQLGHRLRVKEGEIMMVSAKAVGEEAAASAAKCIEQKLQYSSRTLCYLVSIAFQAPQAVKMEKPENLDICHRDAKQLCAVIRKERALELA